MIHLPGSDYEPEIDEQMVIADATGGSTVQLLPGFRARPMLITSRAAGVAAIFGELGIAKEKLGKLRKS